MRLLTLQRSPIEWYFLFAVWEVISVLFCGLIGPYALNPVLDQLGFTTHVTPVHGMLIGLVPVSPFVLLAVATGTWIAI